MLIEPCCFFKIARGLKAAIKFFVIITSFVMIWSIYSLLREETIKNPMVNLVAQDVNLKKLKSLNINMLSDKKFFDPIYLKDVDDQVLFFEKNGRPDAYDSNDTICFGFKDQKQQKMISIGEKCYLKYEKGHLQIAAEPTLSWIKIKSFNSEQVVFEAGVMIINEEGEGYHEKASYQKGYEKLSPLHDEELYHLDTAKWWTPDLLYGMYGGEEYAKFKGCHRLVILDEIQFIHEQSLLVFKEGAWKITDFIESNQQYPLAQVVAVNGEHMKIRVWDITGRRYGFIELVPENKPVLNFKMQEVFAKIKQRSSKQVSCKVGSKMMLLNQGDWIIRSGHDWRVIKSGSELERILAFKLKGELFIVDGIEKVEGNSVFKGHLFDTMRTQMIEVAFPIKEYQKKPKKDPRHKTIAGELQITESQGKDGEVMESSKSLSLEEEELLKLTSPTKQHGTAK